MTRTRDVIGTVRSRSIVLPAVVARQVTGLGTRCAAVQSPKAVTVHFLSEQVPPFGFARWST